MSNDFDDDFDSGYIDEDEGFYGETENASAGGGQSFLVAIIALIAIMVIAVLCISAVVLSRRASNGQDEAVAAIEATNAAIQQTNIAVTVAIEQTETAKAIVQPTFTPEVENTPTPETPPTETPVVELASSTPETEEGSSESGEGGEGEESGEGSGETETGTETEAGEGEGESEEGSGESTDSGNGTIIVGATATPTPTPISGSSGKDSTLPETGLEIWVVALMGLVLIAILFGARRLRTD